MPVLADLLRTSWLQQGEVRERVKLMLSLPCLSFRCLDLLLPIPSSKAATPPPLALKLELQHFSYHLLSQNDGL